jgi:hypothetical protein
MHPELHINYVAILVAAAANIVLGFLWYGPLFGKAWIKEMGLSPDQKPAPGVMMRGMILMIVGSFLTAYVLAFSVEIWRPSTWSLGLDRPNWVYGHAAGFFTWIGFHVPVLFNSVAWEMRSWKLFTINAAYHFVSLQAIGLTLAYWR